MKKLPISFLFILVFLSGGVAILYETIWFHNLTLVMGSTALALTLILTSFMLGLGLGSLIFGGIADKRNPLKIYQVLEFGIGLFALLSLFLFSPLNIIYQTIYDFLNQSPFLLSTFRFIFSMLFLLPPTLFMGGTLPVAVKYLTREYEKKGKSISSFYWVNTFGASVMALAGPLFLMLYFDMNQLLIFGALTNFIIATLIFFLPPYEEKKEEKVEEILGKKKINILPFLAFFLSGTGSLAIETLWNRHLILIFGGSVYTFGLILSIYLFGIVSGSIFISLLKLKEKIACRLFYFGLIICAFLISISLFLLPQISFWQLKILSKHNLTFLNYNLVNFFITFIFIFPVTFCFGIAFPSALIGLSENIKTLGKKVGILMGINSVGTALGPILLTFFILPFLNFQKSYVFIVLLLLISALFMAIYLKEKFFIYLIFLFPIALSFLVPKWKTLNFLLGTPKSPQFAIHSYKKMGGKVDLTALNILWEKNDIEAHIAILQNPGNIKSLIINGKADASDGADMFTQSLSGHLPFLFDRKIEEVLLIGLGSGVSTHCVLTHPIKSIKSVEISPAVIEGAKKYFSHVNYLCFNDKRSKIIAQDGRAYLSLSKEKYDLIISEPSNPWLKGVASLFTKEFFEISKERLKEGGILCQWLNLYNLSLQNILNVLNTLKSVFPNIICFYNSESNDLLFFASLQELIIDKTSLENLPENARAQLKQINISDIMQIYKRFLWNEKELNYKPTMPLNKDKFPWLELLAPKDVFLHKIEENIIEAMKINDSSKIKIKKEENGGNLLLSKNIGIFKEFSSVDFETFLISKTFYPYGEEIFIKRKVGFLSKNNEGRVFSFLKEGEGIDYYVRQFYDGISYNLKTQKINNKEFFYVECDSPFYIFDEEKEIHIIFLKGRNL